MKMPTESVYVEADVAVEHGELKVYHTYEYEDVDQGPQRYYYRVEDGDDEAKEFDVRELPQWAEREHPPYLSGVKDPEERARLDAAWKVYHDGEQEYINAVIRRAIDEGSLTEDGVVDDPNYGKSDSEVAMGCRYGWEEQDDHESNEYDEKNGLPGQHKMYPITDFADSDLVGILTDCTPEFAEHVMKLLNERDANGNGLPRPGAA